jgi:CRISPR-associated endonuclease/helicase Cas3
VRPFSPLHHTDEACALLQAQHRPALAAWRDALLPIADLEDHGDQYLFAAAFSHHGKPRNGRDLVTQRDLPDRFRPLGDGRDPLDLARALVAALPARDGPSPLSGLAPERQRFACHWLMGLVNLADWLGSNTEWFPLRPQRGEAFDRTAAVARGLSATGLTGEALLELAGDDATLISRVLALYTEGEAADLRPVQIRAVEAIVARPPDPGDVLVLEEETGGGKTLTAYLIHALLARRELVSGLTFCLPTRASAKAIHDGAARVYRRFPPVLALQGYDEAAASALPDDAAHDAIERNLPWAQRSRHRFLVAPTAVGTVDQLLLGTLTVPYAHLRSCAVAPNLLVVDEVHASDPYMRELLAEAVTRQRRLGGITLLMSATLGAELRARLLTTGRSTAPVGLRRGYGAQPAAPTIDPEAAISAPYPVLWRAFDDPVRLSDGEPEQKVVRVELCADFSIDAVERIAGRAIAAAFQGARVLVIRNTVRLARATTQAILERAPELLLRHAGHAVCHHARYAGPDRLALDEVLRAALHPDPASRTGQGLVAVTTQTAEQSLDVDSDLLITDLVPADVLLQRIGRLHRNRTRAATDARPEAFRQPSCVVLAPNDAEALLAFAIAPGRGPNNWGADRAYLDVLALAATHRLITDVGPVWTVPADNRRLVEEATNGRRLSCLAVRYGSAGEEASRRSRGKEFFDREIARGTRFSFSDDPSLDTLRDRFDTRSEGEAVTRLGFKDIRLTFAEPFISPFGNPIAAVTIPGHIALVLGLTGDWTAFWTSASDHAVTIEAEGHGARFTYDPLGLEVAAGAGS